MEKVYPIYWTTSILNFILGPYFIWHYNDFHLAYCEKNANSSKQPSKAQYTVQNSHNFIRIIAHNGKNSEITNKKDSNYL
jgi:hypothetical protein